MKILKFGGTSLGTPEAMGRACGIVAEAARHQPVVVVVSALSGVTHSLVSAADAALDGAGDPAALAVTLERRHEGFLEAASEACLQRWVEVAVRRQTTELSRLLQILPMAGASAPPLRDRVLAVGERMSAPLFAAALRLRGVRGEVFDGSHLIATDSTFGQAEPDREISRRFIGERFSGLPAGVVPVVTGFIGADSDGRTTTLGRGGSDRSASLLGWALEAEKIEIWTDVDGILDGPPEWLPEAGVLPSVTYSQAAELALLGARVLHPASLELPAEAEIPIVVRNGAALHQPGTAIDGRPAGELPPILAVAGWRPLIRLRARGAKGRQRLERALRGRGVEVLAKGPSRGRWAESLFFAQEDLPRVLTALEQRDATDREAGFCLLGAVGRISRDQAQGLLRQAGITVVAVEPGPGGFSQRVVVPEAESHRALQILHGALQVLHGTYLGTGRVAEEREAFAV